MNYVSKEELERYKKYLTNEISAFIKKCPNCKSMFKDYLDYKVLCLSCERDKNYLNKLK
jgi:uncharacterized protein (DUF983 family)